MLTALARVGPWPAPPARSAEPGAARLVATWQAGPEPALGGVVDPVDVAVAADGAVYVVDRGLNRVQRFDAEGRAVQQIGHPGGGDSGLASPFGVAIDAARDRLFVADRDHQRLAVFKRDGAFLESWGDYAKPEALAIGLDGRVHAYDRGANAIVGRKADGGRDVNIDVPFAQSPFALLPHGLATDRAGMIWFASEAPVVTLRPVIWVFRPSGEVSPPRTQVPWVPRDLAIDPADRLYILDGEGARLVTDFDRANPARNSSAAIARNVRAIAAAEPSVVHLLDGPTWDREGGVTVVHYDGRTLSTRRRWSFPPLEPGWFQNPLRVAAGRDGRIYVVDETHRAQRFGTGGQAEDLLRRPGMQEVDATAEGDWLVARTRTASSIDDAQDPDVAPEGMQRIRIERYRPAPGGPTRLWSHDWTEPVGAADHSLVYALAHDPARDRAYALDRDGGRVLVLGLGDGAIRATWDLAAGDGRAIWSDLAVGPDGTVWALDTAAPRLARLDGDGKAVSEVPAPKGALRFALGPRGEVALVTIGREVQWRAAGEADWAAWPLPAPSRGAPEPPSDVAIGAEGRVYVTDRGGQAVYVFEIGGGDAGGRVCLPALGNGSP